MVPDSVLNALSSSATFLSIAPIVTGAGLSVLKPFARGDDTYKADVAKQKSRLFECAAVALTNLLLKLDAPLRGSGPNEPDLVAAYLKESFRVFNSYQRLDSMRVWFRRCHSALWITAAAGAPLSLMGFIFAAARPTVALTGILLLGFQVCAVSYSRYLEMKLEEYEATN